MTTKSIPQQVRNKKHEIFVQDTRNLRMLVIPIQLNLFQPLFKIFKRICSRYVVYQNNAMGTPVIGARKSSKAFLTSGIPNSELYSSSTHIEVLHFEIDTNGGLNVIVEGIIREPK
mgnify:CR=1 FL=1